MLAVKLMIDIGIKKSVHELVFLTVIFPGFFFRKKMKHAVWNFLMMIYILLRSISKNILSGAINRHVKNMIKTQ